MRGAAGGSRFAQGGDPLTASTTPLAALGLAFVLGWRHALEVDHLAAVSTMVSERPSLRSSSLAGALWGLGHTASLLAVAVVMLVLHVQIPAALAPFLELGVALMLLGLGARLLWTLWRGGAVHHHVHAHGDRVHVHLHAHRADTIHRAERSAVVQHDHHRGVRRPFLVGVTHGLAGSAAMMLAVVVALPDPVLALAYVAVFGVGSICGMVVASALLGAPIVIAVRRFAAAMTVARVCAAAASIAVGISLAWHAGIQAGFFV